MTTTRRSILAAAGVAVGAGAQGLPTTGSARTAPPSLVGPWTGGGFVQRAGGRIHYVEMGRGEPLILLHKLGGWVADWREIAPLLAVNRRVIAIDMPGHGDSAMLGEPPYLQTVPESAAMIRATLDELGVDRFSLVGNSIGGCTGVVMAALWPRDMRKLVLLSVSLSEAESRALLAQQDAELVASKNYDAQDNPLPRDSVQVARFGTKDPEVIAESNLSRDKGGRWVRPSERGVGRAGVADYLSRIEAPTLLIYGEQGYYRQFQAIGLKTIKDSRAVVIPDCGSFTHQEKPRETAEAINAFLG